MTERFKCEVRYLLTLAARKGQDAYLEAVEKKRGKEESDKLRQEARKQWAGGNRGEKGNWK